MKTLPSQKSNLAWFKLADFVVKGEKERALGVYKLLTHSVPDKAFCCQLEADIFLAFGDEQAIDKYHAAANLYKKQGLYYKAIAVYEYVSLYMQDASILEALLDVYVHLKQFPEACATFARFADIQLVHDNFGSVMNTLHLLTLHHSSHVAGNLYAAFVFVLIKHQVSSKQVQFYIKHALDSFCEQKHPQADVQWFLEKLLDCDETMYDFAHAYSKNFL